MKTAFFHYYKPNEEEFSNLWKECIFSLDANVLLNVYRYSEATSTQLIELLEKISERIVLPYQFALEFHRNRISAIGEQIKYFIEAEKSLEKFINEQVTPKRKHPFLTENAIGKFNDIQTELKDSRVRHESLFGNDSYLEKITNIIGSVSEKPSNLTDLHSKARERYASKIPPGYMDADKGEPNSFGDCIAWLQLIEISSNTKKPLILVCDDAKEDWWEIHNHRTIGPRIELKEEFQRETSQLFYMYSSDQFMKFANEYLGGNITPSAIEEAKERILTLSKMTEGEKNEELDPVKSAYHLVTEEPKLAEEKHDALGPVEETPKGY